MAFRFKPQHTPRWYERKAALLRRGKEDILNEYRRDCEDRERMRGGHALASARQQELASACDSHLYQLDMRYETMQQLQDLLLCQVRRHGGVVCMQRAPIESHLLCDRNGCCLCCSSAVVMLLCCATKTEQDC